ncbi:MAG TPA: hypothetical protein VGW38_26605, partial [Chloroflexota bacterium]|nr:hypothetical protein [Chloroflexota bacterium]
MFNADHTRLAEELRRIEDAGIDFLHLDVFDGYVVPDQGFPARTIAALRRLTKLPFEVHLTAQEPLRFVPALAEAGVDLVFLPAETTPLLYEATFELRQRGLRAGICLALGTPLEVLPPILPMVDAVLLLGRVTAEGARGRDFNRLVLDRVRAVRAMIDAQVAAGGPPVDLQAAGGLETESCVEVCRLGATSLPLGSALHRELDPGAYVRHLRGLLVDTLATSATIPATSAASPDADADVSRSESSGDAEKAAYRVFIASRSFGKSTPEVLDAMRAAGCEILPNDLSGPPTEEELITRLRDVDALISGTEPVTARVIEAAPRLKVISKHGVGYDNIDVATAAARGIPVCIAGGA